MSLPQHRLWPTTEDKAVCQRPGLGKSDTQPRGNDEPVQAVHAAPIAVRIVSEIAGNTNAPDRLSARQIQRRPA